MIAGMFFLTYAVLRDVRARGDWQKHRWHGSGPTLKTAPSCKSSLTSVLFSLVYPPFGTSYSRWLLLTVFKSLHNTFIFDLPAFLINSTSEVTNLAIKKYDDDYYYVYYYSIHDVCSYNKRTVYIHRATSISDDVNLYGDCWAQKEMRCAVHKDRQNRGIKRRSNMNLSNSPTFVN